MICVCCVIAQVYINVHMYLLVTVIFDTNIYSITAICSISYISTVNSHLLLCELSSTTLWNTSILSCVIYMILKKISSSCETFDLYSWSITYISKYIFISNCCITWYVKVYYYLFSDLINCHEPLLHHIAFFRYDSHIVYRLFLYILLPHCIYYTSHVKERWILLK